LEKQYKQMITQYYNPIQTMTFTADIYKLCCLDPEITDVYVGSTRSWRQRKSMHKSRCNNETSECYNSHVYQFIRGNGGWENWDMVSLYTGQFESKLELLRKEREYLEQLGATLNKLIPSRRLQPTEADKEHIREYHKQYREQHKEQFLEKSKLYRERNKEQISTKKKQYYERKKEHFLKKKQEIL